MLCTFRVFCQKYVVVWWVLCFCYTAQTRLAPNPWNPSHVTLLAPPPPALGHCTTASPFATQLNALALASLCQRLAHTQPPLAPLCNQLAQALGQPAPRPLAMADAQALLPLVGITPHPEVMSVLDALAPSPDASQRCLLPTELVTDAPAVVLPAPLWQVPSAWLLPLPPVVALWRDAHPQALALLSDATLALALAGPAWLLASAMMNEPTQTQVEALLTATLALYPQAVAVLRKLPPDALPSPLANALAQLPTPLATQVDTTLLATLAHVGITPPTQDWATLAQQAPRLAEGLMWCATEHRQHGHLPADQLPQRLAHLRDEPLTPHAFYWGVWLLLATQQAPWQADNLAWPARLTLWENWEALLGRSLETASLHQRIHPDALALAQASATETR
jgi:hypothetical protein